jgi:hypothetical protein
MRVPRLELTLHRGRADLEERTSAMSHSTDTVQPAELARARAYLTALDRLLDAGFAAEEAVTRTDELFLETGAAA